jgi:hypothetical protein
MDPSFMLITLSNEACSEGGLPRLRKAAMLFIATAILSGCEAELPEPPNPPVVEATPQQQGLWQPTQSPRLTAEQEQEIERLLAIGYASGKMPARSVSGVVHHVREAVSAGLNLYTSGHAAEAMLMDSDGKALHVWSKPYHEVAWRKKKKTKLNEEASPLGTEYWRRVHLYENGDLLALYEGQGLIKLDRNSKVLWVNSAHIHHDFEVLENGDILVLSREAHMRPRINKVKPVLEDFVLRLAPDGSVKNKISVFESIKNSDFAKLLLPLAGREGDFLHTNSLQVLDGRHADRLPEFAAGNVLTSMRITNSIAVLDLEREQVVWAQLGTWKRQHDPVMLPDGHLLLFDNEGMSGVSRVLEFDPVDMSLVWEHGGPPGDSFFSEFCGAAQRLPNGNTLISISWEGRVIEVTANHELVNPNQTGEEGEFIAVIPELIRLPAIFPTDWIPAAD